MPRQIAFAIDIKPIKGFVTEYTKLAFPEQAAIETDNAVFFKNALGEGVSNVSCRPSLNRVGNRHNKTQPSLNQNRYSWYEWQNPGNLNTEDSILVIQDNNVLTFYIVDNTFLSPTSAPQFILDLETLKVTGAPHTSDYTCSFAEANGYLFVAHPYCDVIRIEYDAGTFNVTQLNLEIRDTRGIDDGLDFITRPTTLSPEHHYNLRNQGWTEDRINQVFTTHNFYPSNADIWFMYKNANNDFDASLLTSPSFPNINMPAPKGWFILDAFNQDRSAVSGIAGLPVYSSGYFRPMAIAYYAGRLWYGSPTHKDFYGKIYFSQTLESIEQAERCYMSNDPTSEDYSDVLDTDGGVIDIGDTGAIFALSPFSYGLIVIAENGVWFISGPQGQSFKPTDFSVTKVSGIQTQNKPFVISANGTPYWWTKDGIYTCVIDQVGNINILSITDETIKSFYDGIDDNQKFMNLTASFDYNSQTILWMYTRSDDSRKGILLFNVKEKTFSVWTFDDENFTHIFSLVDKKIDTDLFGNTPTVFQTYLYSTSRTTSESFFAAFNDKSKTVDFGETPEISNRPFHVMFSVGYRIHGGLVRQFQNPYIFLYLNNTPNTYLKFTSYWGFYKRDDYPTVAQTQEMRDNPFYNPYTVIKKRLRIRGRGDAVVFTFENEPGHVFDLLGWGTREIVEGDS